MSLDREFASNMRTLQLNSIISFINPVQLFLHSQFKVGLNVASARPGIHGVKVNPGQQLHCTQVSSFKNKKTSVLLKFGAKVSNLETPINTVRGKKLFSIASALLFTVLNSKDYYTKLKLFIFH